MPASEGTNKCDVCQNLATKICGGCHNIFYCNKEHQLEGWKSHKKECKPFKICENEKLGRYLLATKPIRAGDVILKEPPLVWGPPQITKPVCLGCGKIISERNSKPCNKCGWPVCSDLCEKSPAHIPECRYTIQRGDKVSIKNFGVIHPNYQSITVLRCLYRKQFLKDTWTKISTLDTQTENRKLSGKYKQDRVVVADFIRRFFKLDTTFSEEEIMEICGILMINGHEVPLTQPSYIALYENTSMFEHSCKANCTKSFTNRGKVLISAAVNIEKDDHLSICYTDPMWGTLNRRQFLYESKFFWCSCPRCSDSTEFGTNFSSIKCQNSNCDGYLLPKTFLNTPIGDQVDDYNWYCSKCDQSLPTKTVYELLEKIGKELLQMRKGVASVCKQFLGKYEKFLHPNHYYLTDVRFALTQLLVDEGKGGLMKVSEEDLALKIKICRNLLCLVKIIAPAEKRMRGLLLFELQESIAEVGRRRATSLADSSELHSALMESKKLLQEVLELLKHEPTCLAEGKVCEQAKLSLKDIDLILLAVHQTNTPTLI